MTRVPDIVGHPGDVVRLGGRALLVLDTPGGGAAEWLKGLDQRLDRQRVDLRVRLVVLLVIVAVVWIPLRRSSLGLSLYAIGSDRLAAFRSGVSGRADEDHRLRPDGLVLRRSAASP